MQTINQALVRISMYSVALVMSVSLTLGSAIAEAKAETVPEELRGVWVIRSYYETPNVWGINKKQADSLVGMRFIYEEGALIACKQRVRIQKVDRREVNSAQFLAGRNSVQFSDVGIHAASIHEIMLNGNAGGNCFGTYAVPGEDVYVKGPAELLVDFEGVYFRATRASIATKTK